MIKVALFFTLFYSYSCSSTQRAPDLKDRRLIICKDRPGLCYNYCAKRKAFSDSCKIWVNEFFDFTDPKVRAELSAMGFSATSDRRWK